MLPILHIGPLAVQTPGLLLLLGLWFGLELAERHAVMKKQEPGKLYNLVLISLIAGILVARLGYAAQYPVAFLKSPLGLFSLSPQMLNPEAGLLAAIITCLIYIQRSKLPHWPTLDLLTSLLAVLAVAQGLAHLASGQAYGTPSDLPWSIELFGALRHPTQVYEILIALIILAVVWPAQVNPLEKRIYAQPGVRLLLFLGLSAAARIFLEAFRGDSLFMLGGLRQAQIIAWLVLALCLWQLGKRLSPRETPGD